MIDHIGERAVKGVFLDGGGLYGTEDAVADQLEFAELHAKHWPEVTVISTMRQISTGPEAPGD